MLSNSSTKPFNSKSITCKGVWIKPRKRQVSRRRRIRLSKNPSEAAHQVEVAHPVNVGDAKAIRAPDRSCLNLPKSELFIPPLVSVAIAGW
jgi:hypothetical protein